MLKNRNHSLRKFLILSLPLVKDASELKLSVSSDADSTRPKRKEEREREREIVSPPHPPWRHNNNTTIDRHPLKKNH